MRKQTTYVKKKVFDGVISKGRYCISILFLNTISSGVTLMTKNTIINL